VEFDKPLRVRLVRECDLVRAGLEALLADHADRVTLVSADPAHVRDPSDVALVDPFTRPTGSADGPAPTQVPRPPGAARVAVFTWEVRDGYVEKAMLGGADGYLSKALAAHELVVALEKVHAGERLVALDGVRRATEPPERTPRSVGLTPRESHVVAMIAAGAANKEIALRLDLSMNTVKSHIRTAYRAMGVTSRTQAVIWAVEHGLTAPWVAVRDEPAA
jgi:two-component system, NarL family, response regulator LiaR